LLSPGAPVWPASGPDLYPQSGIAASAAQETNKPMRPMFFTPPVSQRQTAM